MSEGQLIRWEGDSFTYVDKITDSNMPATVDTLMDSAGNSGTAGQFLQKSDPANELVWGGGGGSFSYYSRSNSTSNTVDFDNVLPFDTLHADNSFVTYSGGTFTFNNAGDYLFIFGGSLDMTSTTSDYRLKFRKNGADVFVNEITGANHKNPSTSYVISFIVDDDFTLNAFKNNDPGTMDVGYNITIFKLS